MKKYKVGLVIGRFQPFHKGHLHLIKEALSIAETIVIGIGTANRQDADNPWSKEERRSMIERVITDEKITNRVVKIVDVNDYLDSDEQWFENAQEIIGKVDIVIGNNNWVNDLYKSHGVPTTNARFFNRFLLEGYKIRKLMRLGKKWQNRVPDYLVKLIRTNI